MKRKQEKWLSLTSLVAIFEANLIPTLVSFNSPISKGLICPITIFQDRSFHLNLVSFLAWRVLICLIHNFELLLKNLTQLRELDLYGVSIASTFSLNFSSYLTTLRLSDTQLRGILPESVFHLSNLKTLDLSFNSQLTIRLME